MSRRRAAREQEKEEFLQQNPDLITFNTRIEVVESEFPPPPPPPPPPPMPPVPPPAPPQAQNLLETNMMQGYGYYDFFFPDVLFTPDGAPTRQADIEDVEGGPNILFAEEVSGPFFEIIAGSTNPANQFFEPFENEGPPIAPPGPIIQETILTITEDGFGVLSGDELLEGPPPEDPQEVVAINEIQGPMMLPPPPDGVSTLGQDEFLGVVVRLPEEEDDDDDDNNEDDVEGGTSFSIDFFASGSGSVVITLFGAEDEEDTITETFFVPRGTAPGSLLNFEVDMPDGTVFDFADVTATGSLEISVIGIDLGTSFDPNIGFLPA